MPIYEYQCGACGARTEILQRLDEAPLTHCPHCGGPMSKLVSAPAFQFKGSGWYVTDYAGKGKAGGAGSARDAGESRTGGESAAGDAAAKEQPKADSKSETKPAPAGGD